MSIVDFITSADAPTFIEVLGRCKCKSCKGSGESNDAELGDMYYQTWVCVSCDGKGWNVQAVREFVEAATKDGEGK